MKWTLRYPILQGLSSPSGGNIALTQPLYPVALRTLVGAVAEHAHEVPTLCHPGRVFPASVVAKWRLQPIRYRSEHMERAKLHMRKDALPCCE
jgi:hypothetical protein